MSVVTPVWPSDGEQLREFRTETMESFAEVDDGADSFAVAIQPQDHFELRGEHYLEDKIKTSAAGPAFQLLGTRIYAYKEMITNVASRIRSIAALLQRHPNFDFVVTNRMLPTTPWLTVVMIFYRPKGALSGQVFERTYKRFLDGDDRYRDLRLKYIVKIPNAPWMVRTAVSALGGFRPVIMGKGYLEQFHFRGPNFYEVDVNIGYSKIAVGVMGAVIPSAKSLIVDEAFVIEGKKQDELPEVMLACIRCVRFDLPKYQVTVTSQMLLNLGESVAIDRLRADTVASVNSVVSHQSQYSARSELSCFDDPPSPSEDASDTEEFYDAVEARSRSGSQSWVRDRSDTLVSNDSDVGLLWGQLGGVGKDPTQVPPQPSMKQSRVLCLMLFLNVLIMYLMRVNLSFAIAGSEGIGHEHNWDNGQQGIVLSAFFGGYITSQLIGGWLATQYGGKVVLLNSMLLASILTGLSPMMVGYGIVPAVAVRALLGMCSGSLYPGSLAMLGRWITLHNRGIAYACIDMGGVLGMAVTGLIAPLIMPKANHSIIQGWEWLFDWPAALGLLWAITWYYVAASDPRMHPRISAAECDWILNELLKEQLEAKSKTLATGSATGSSTGQALQMMITSPALWGQFVVNFAGNWLFYTLLTFLPTFMYQTLGFDVNHAGPYFAIPYLCFGIGELLTAQISDRLVSNGRFRPGEGGGMSVLGVRTWVPLLTSAAMIGFYTAIAVGAVSSKAGIIVLFSGLLWFYGMAALNPFLVANDLFPETAGLAMGISNTLGTIPGIVSPVLTGNILKRANCSDSETEGEQASPECVAGWHLVFVISIVVYAVGILLYVFLIRCERQGVGYYSLQRGFNTALRRPSSQMRNYGDSPLTVGVRAFNAFPCKIHVPRSGLSPLARHSETVRSPLVGSSGTGARYGLN